MLTLTSRNCGLLVIGAPHTGGMAAVLVGTPAYRIIHDATCPVMLVH
jgi:nucleotide-binding universal stress UspA family protein